jgi:hypothetical protein
MNSHGCLILAVVVVVVGSMMMMMMDMIHVVLAKQVVFANLQHSHWHEGLG